MDSLSQLRSQVKVLLGYHPRVVHEDGTETPEGYDISTVEPSDARVAGKNVFAQGASACWRRFFWALVRSGSVLNIDSGVGP